MSERASILVCDDEPIIRETLAEFLTQFAVARERRAERREHVVKARVDDLPALSNAVALTEPGSHAGTTHAVHA